MKSVPLTVKNVKTASVADSLKAEPPNEGLEQRDSWFTRLRLKTSFISPNF